MSAIQALLRKNKRPRSDDSSAQTVSSSSIDHTPPLPPPRSIVHYDDKHPIPFLLDDSFPREAYRSRHMEVKTAIHWGQRKLLISEIQLLCYYAKREVSYHIVYAGSAPGTHLAFLDELTNRRHTWELVDPGQFDRPVLEPRKNFLLRNEFFTNATAYGINANSLNGLPGLQKIYRWVAIENETIAVQRNELHDKLKDIIGTLDVARGTTDIPSMYEPPLQLPVGIQALCSVAMERRPTLFVSDIRSGSPMLPNFEEHVAENMKAQQTWTEILQADYAMLKFRLPYTSSHGISEDGTVCAAHETVASHRLISPDGTVEYLDGDMVIPIWTRPTSTEGRLVVPRGARRKHYRVDDVEAQFFFLNARLREYYHFNHILAPHPALDGHFDAAAEVQCLRHFLCFMDPSLEKAESLPRLRNAIEKLVDRISGELRCDFAGAIRRRDTVIMRQAKMGCIEGREDEDGGAGWEGQMVTPLPDHHAGSTSDGGTPAGAKSWEGEARLLMDIASRERTRVLWWRNVDPTGVAHPTPDTSSPVNWRSIPL